MKRTLGRIFSAASLLAVPAAAWAADGSVDSTTIVRIEQRDTGSQKERIVPATEFLGLDAEKLADGNLSLHLYGWGRADLADHSFNDRELGGRLTYGFLKYRFKAANGEARAGRLFVHDGINNEQIDGVALRTDLPGGFGVSAFGGATVHTAHIFGNNTDGKGNGIVGGRINFRLGGMLELGASGVYETKAPTLTPTALQPQPHSADHRLAGGDIWFSPHKVIEILGHTSYNTETNKVAEHSYLLNLKPLQHLTVSGDFNQQNDRSFLYAWSMFSAAALNPSDQSRNFGGVASYQATKAVEVAADYKHYHRTLGDADRYGANAKFSFLDNMARAGVGYHYLRADSGFAIIGTPSGSYQELRGWAMHDTTRFFGALDIIDYIFKDKVFNERMAWEALGSLGYHITPSLALSCDFSYGRSPEFTEEVKGLVRLTYNTTFTSAGGKK